MDGIIGTSGFTTFLVMCIIISDCHALSCRFNSPKKLWVKSGKEREFQSESVRDVLHYYPNQDCEWLLEADDSGNVVVLTMKYYQLQGRDIRGQCNNDYVDIIDIGSDPPKLLERLCGEIRTEQTYTSSGPQMKVRFISDNSFQYSGFVATVTAAVSEKVLQNSEQIVNLAVGIPISLFLVFCVAAIVVGVHRRRKTSRSPPTRQQTRTQTRQQLNQPSIERSGVQVTRPFVPPDTALPAYSRYENQHDQLQVELPPHSPHSQYQPSQTVYDELPPAYDAIRFEPSNLLPSAQPATPPAYEDVVKDNRMS